MLQRATLGGERVLITGASGGVGSAAVQLAKRRGAHVTAITSRAKMKALKELGADVTIDRTDAFPKGAFDVVLDLMGGPRWSALLDALSDIGHSTDPGPRTARSLSLASYGAQY